MFKKPTSLVVAGRILQGCGFFEQMFKIIAFAKICNEVLLNETLEIQSAIVGDKRDKTACVKKEIKKLSAVYAVNCATELLNGTDSETPDDEKLQEEAEQWFTGNKKMLEKNFTGSIDVDKCKAEVEVDDMQEKYLTDIVEAKFNDEEMTKKSHLSACVAAAGVGIALAASAVVIHRYASTASTTTETDIEQESVLLDELEDA